MLRLTRKEKTAQNDTIKVKKGMKKYFFFQENFFKYENGAPQTAVLKYG